MRSLSAIALSWLLACVTAWAPIAAQDQPGVSIAPRVRPAKDAAETVLDRRPNLRIDTTLVPIPVVVTKSANGQVLTGLEKKNFRLYEDKVEQEILTLSTEDAPLSLGVVFDASGSMGGKLQRSREAVAQFMMSANPVDEFFLVQFNDRPELAVSFTSDSAQIQNRLTFLQSKGSTALLDGVYLAINEMKKARHGRKAILIISDGGDNNSRFTESELKTFVREADVQIYAIGIYEPVGARGRTPEELSGPGLLADITESTGGKHFSVENLADLPDVAAKISLELRNQYVLSYRPKNETRDGKYRKVEVKLVNVSKLPPLRARYREGYYAPAQ
jgi:Ca-activated chloride channel family protein